MGIKPISEYKRTGSHSFSRFFRSINNEFDAVNSHDDRLRDGRQALRDATDALQDGAQALQPSSQMRQVDAIEDPDHAIDGRQGSVEDGLGVAKHLEDGSHGREHGYERMRETTTILKRVWQWASLTNHLFSVAKFPLSTPGLGLLVVANGLSFTAPRVAKQHNVSSFLSVHLCRFARSVYILSISYVIGLMDTSGPCACLRISTKAFL